MSGSSQHSGSDLSPAPFLRKCLELCDGLQIARPARGARGGFTRDPYLLGMSPAGSSSGSAVAAAANLCAAAVGTETDGSIISPAALNLVVGLKPTVGLVSQRGIIPLAASQDTAGPMCRTVTDAAILLGVMQSPFGEVLGHSVPSDYTTFLRRGSLAGARIGVDRRYFLPEFGGEPDLVAMAERALDAMRALGATLIDIAPFDPFDSGDPFGWFDAEFTVLLSEFKVQIAEYLAGLSHTRMRTLADLIAFNTAHCRQEMYYFGQEVFEMAEATSGDLTDPAYVEARELCLRLTRAEGIDRALSHYALDMTVGPGWSFAGSNAAVSGYPSMSLPVGLTPEGRPAALTLVAGFLQEPTLLKLASDLEQELQPRVEPRFVGEVPPQPDPSGLCGAAPEPRAPGRRGRLTHHLGTGKRLPAGY